MYYKMIFFHLYIFAILHNLTQYIFRPCRYKRKIADKYTYDCRYVSTQKIKNYIFIPFQIEHSKNNLAHSQKQLKTLLHREYEMK